MARASTSKSLLSSLLVSPTLVTTPCLLLLILFNLVTSAYKSEEIERKVCWSPCGQENAIQVAILNRLLGQRKVGTCQYLVHLYNHRVISARFCPEKPFDNPLFEKLRNMFALLACAGECVCIKTEVGKVQNDVGAA